MSALKLNGTSYPAFSGSDGFVNRRSSACIRGKGPLPPGEYYIFKRQSGGLLGPLKDSYSGKGSWFALHKIDGRIDDETLCENVLRGKFRLHPSGALGISEGCVTIAEARDFVHISAILKARPPVEVPGSVLKAYGILTVS